MFNVEVNYRVIEMMHCVRVVFVLVVITSAALSQESDSIRDELHSVLVKQAEAWNNGNIEGYMEGYWKSDSLLFTSGGNIQRGWKATLEKYKKSFDTKDKMGKLAFSEIESYLISPATAWVFGQWELQRAADTVGGVFTLIFRKFPDGWKIIHDHTSKH
jgi:beta-aspartyl-peptidase (threonine type)